MKHEYVGDHKDYYKYSLLSHLASHDDVAVHVCWMLTGEYNFQTSRDWVYLTRRNEWSGHDPRVFDALKDLVCDDRRNVAEIEKSGLIPNGSFFSREFEGTNKAKRLEYFYAFNKCLKDCSSNREHPVIFFDPDNGFKSSPRHLPKESVKFIFLNEVAKYFQQGYSVILIQFPSLGHSSADFARERETRIIKDFQKKPFEIDPSGLVCCLDCEVYGGRPDKDRRHCILYFIISQRKSLPLMREMTDGFLTKWGSRIRVPVTFCPVE